MQKLKRMSLFKTLILMNQLTDPSLVDRLVNAVNILTFQIFAHFLVFFIPLPFLVEIPNFFFFYAQCQMNFDFWSKFDHYLSICLYDAYDMKFMQSEGIFIKNSLNNH